MNAGGLLEKRTAGRTLIFFGVVAIAAGAAVVVVFGTPGERVSLTILGYSTNRWSFATSDGKQSYVSATVAMTNRTSRSVSYWGRGKPQGVEYEVLHQAASGRWERTGSGFKCGFGVIECKLPPSGGVQFQAVVDETQPCKIAVYYGDSQKPSAVWKHLPPWLAQRLAWLRTEPRAVTDEINLASVK